MRQRAQVFKGDLGPLWNVQALDNDGNPYNISDVNWTAKVAIKGTDVDRNVTTKAADNLSFEVQLATTETEKMSVNNLDNTISPRARGVHLVGVEITNTTLSYVRETQFIVQVLPKVK